VRLVVVGAGGHARSVIDALRAAGEHELVACTDPRADLAGSQVDGIDVVGDDSQLERLREEGVEGAVMGVGGVRDNGLRERLFDSAAALGFALPSVVHQRAAVAAGASLADGAVVLACAVVGPGATVGRNAIVNSGALVEHDCSVGDHAHVATGAALAGGVAVGERAHVGVGAAVVQGVSIGAGAVAGAGAVVIRDVPAGAVVAGSPARDLETHG
jgi:UDP-perosamine 4-acetyltransferase